MYRAWVVVSACVSSLCIKCVCDVSACVFYVCLANLALGDHDLMSGLPAYDEADNHLGFKKVLPRQQSVEKVGVSGRCV